jgi:hypothetical protein
MNMRLDYPLYGLAIVLFAAAAFLYFLHFEYTYPLTAAILGLLLIGSGFFSRPKAASVPVASTPAATPDTKPASQGTPATEAPEVASSPVEPAPVVETPKPVSKPEPIVQPAIPALEPVVAPLAIAAPPVEAALPAPAAATKKAKTAFSQIRSISVSRAEQLKSLGITSIAELAGANPEELAAKLNVSAKIVKMWVGSAKKLK